MMALLDYIDSVPPLTLGQILVCVLPLVIVQTIALVIIIGRGPRK